MKTSRHQISAYRTKDGSEIRELLHPEQHGGKNQSLAEATVLSGQTTQKHFHKQTEEIYFILEGSGQMFLGDEVFEVRAGDSVLINPGTTHCIQNNAPEILRFLCCCSPAYQHNDTFLTEIEN